MEDNTQANIDLCEAIKTTSLVKVMQAIQQGADPHARIDYTKHFSPWKWAYGCRNRSIIRYLLENGADPNSRLEETFSQTLIFGAILSLEEKIIKLLVEKGASLDIIDDDGYTPLYMVLGHSEPCLSLVPLLLRLGANMKVGIRKLDKIKKEDQNAYEMFCRQILRFLEVSDQEGDYKALRPQLPKILEVSEHLPAYVVEKAKELAVYYCYSSDDDDNAEESETDLDTSSIVEDSFKRPGTEQPETHSKDCQIDPTTRKKNIISE